MKVLIGVDPHKKSVNAVAAIGESGELVGHEVFPANRKGLRALERWSKRFARRRWAVEGAAGIGRPVAQKLVASGEEVVDVPPKLSAKVRVLSVGNARKNDHLDATFTALAALSNERLARVSSEDSAGARVEVLRLLTERREDLVAERTRALNRLHVLLRDLLSDGVAKGLSASAATKLLRRARPRHAVGRTRKRLASELVREVRALDRKIASLDKRIREEVETSGTALTEIFGIGPILAAKLVGIVGDVARFPSKAHYFASSEDGSPPSRLPAARWSGIGFRSPGTAASTRCCTWGCRLPSPQRSSRASLLPQETGRRQVAQGGDAVPQAACLRRCVQGSRRGFRPSLTDGGLTQRGLCGPFKEVAITSAKAPIQVRSETPSRAF
jgi:transposase